MSSVGAIYKKCRSYGILVEVVCFYKHAASPKLIKIY